MATEVFQPIGPPTTIAASTTTATASLGGPTYKDVVLHVVNMTNGTAFVAGGATATLATGFPVGPSSSAKFRLLGGFSAVAVILSAGATAGSVIVCPGEGGV